MPIASKAGSNQDSAKLNNDKLSSSLATEPKSTADIQGGNNDGQLIPGHDTFTTRA